MEKLIEEMFYNSFTMKNNDEQAVKLRNLSEQMLQKEMELRSILSTQALAVFEKYLECSGELMSCNGCVEFVSGFRLGGRLTSEILFGAGDDTDLCG